MFKSFKNNKPLVRGVFMYISFSVLGPLLTIGAIGYILDRLFGTKPFILLGSVLVSYVFSNFLIFKKVKEFNLAMEKYKKEDVEGDSLGEAREEERKESK